MKQLVLLFAILACCVALIWPTPSPASGLFAPQTDLRAVRLVYPTAVAYVETLTWPAAVVTTRTTVRQVSEVYVTPLATVSEVTVSKRVRVAQRVVAKPPKMTTVTILGTTQLPVRACTQAGSAPAATMPPHRPPVP